MPSSRNFVCQVLHVNFTFKDLDRILDGIDQLLVTGTATGVAVFLEPVADVFTRRIRIAVNQGLGGNNKAWGTKSALGPAVHHPGHLQGMEIAWGADTLNSSDSCTISHSVHLGDAGPEQLAVDNNVAGTALPLAATYLGTGESQGFTDHVG